jgi:hypothetical protein
MATTGNVFAGTGENNAGIGATAWTSPTSVTADDGTDATCNAGASSQYLVARNFDFSSIPNEAVITGITVRIDASEHSAGTESLNAQLQDASGTLTGSSQAQTISGTTKAVYTYGSTTDVWGATLTPAVVKDADFGVRFWFTTSHDVRLDYVTMAVEYQLPPTPTTRAAAPQQTVARERVGCAVAFLAAAAHIPAPPGTDTIGSAQYTSGTHQAALAERQSKPWVRQTPTPLIPAAAVADSPATRVVITLPQRAGERAPQVWHALIPSDVIRGRLLATGPQSVATPQPAITKSLIPAPAVLDSPLARIVTTTPQRAGDLQASISKALITEPVVGSDVIGAANYTVGTHRPTQVRPAIFRALIPAVVAGTDVQFTRLITAAPQRVPSGSAHVYGQQPGDIEERLFSRYYEADQQIGRQPQPYFAKPSISGAPPDVQLARLFVATPQRVQPGQAHVYGYTPSAAPSNDVSFTKLISAAPQQVPSGSASIVRARIDDTALTKTLVVAGQALQQLQPVFAKALIDALPISTLQPKTLQAGHWSWQQPQPALFRSQIEPLPITAPNARAFYAYQQVLDQRPVQFFGHLVVEAVLADKPSNRFVTTVPQSEGRSTSQVWHAQISEVAFGARFVCVAPQPAVTVRAWVESPPTAYQVLGTDTAIGTFGFADQRFVPIQYAIASRISVSWQVAGGRVATFEASFDDVFFDSQHDDGRFDPIAFDVTQFDAKEA